MKKILLIFIVPIFFIGCSDKSEKPDVVEKNQVNLKKEFKKQMQEKYKDHEVDIIGNDVFVTVGYYKNHNNNNRSFTVFTTSNEESELLEMARRQMHTDFRQTSVHFFNDFDKTINNSLSNVTNGMYLSDYNKEAKFAEYRKTNYKDEFGKVETKEIFYYFKNGNDNTYCKKITFVNGVEVDE